MYVNQKCHEIYCTFVPICELSVPIALICICYFQNAINAVEMLGESIIRVTCNLKYSATSNDNSCGRCARSRGVPSEQSWCSEYFGKLLTLSLDRFPFHIRSFAVPAFMQLLRHNSMGTVNASASRTPRSAVEIYIRMLIAIVTFANRASRFKCKREPANVPFRSLVIHYERVLRIDYSS